MLQWRLVIRRARRRGHAGWLSSGVSQPAKTAVLAAVFLTVTFAAAADQDLVPIGAILDDPDGYHLTTVGLAGVVSGVTALEPYYIPSGAACYGAYTFTLTDGTGSLSIDVLGFCGRPVFRPPPMVDGDAVIVTAHIRAPGHEGYYQGLIGVPIPEQRTDMGAIATVIRRAPSPPGALADE